jgi:hypothetical protein
MPDMNLPTNVYTDADGSVYVQIAPAAETHFIGGCFEAGDLPNPKYDVDPIYCLTADRSFQAVGATRTMPGKITSTVTGLTEDSAGWLELFAEDFCPFFIHFVQHKCGTRGVWAHWERVHTYLVRALTDDVVSGFMSREGGNVTTRAINWTGFPPRVSSRRLGIGSKMDYDGVMPVSTIWAEPKNCSVDCGTHRMLGEVLYYSDTTAAGPRVNVSTDFGESWVDTAAIEAVGGYFAEAGAAVQLDRDTVRQICLMYSANAVPLHVRYSDDSGATWATAAIDAAGTIDPITGASQALHALDSEHIWAGDETGEVHFSDDAGLTWTNQGAALAAQGVMSIDFYDANIGVCAGVTGLVSVSIDGGTNWAAATVPEAQTINSIRFTGPSSQHLVCVTLNGNVWYSRDRGANWTETWAGNGTAIKCLDVASPTVYFLIDDDGGSNDIYQTVDGGLTFQEYTTPVNTELEHIIVLSPTLVFAVGNAGAAVPVIIKLGQGVS